MLNKHFFLLCIIFQCHVPFVMANSFLCAKLELEPIFQNSGEDIRILNSIGLIEYTKTNGDEVLQILNPDKSLYAVINLLSDSIQIDNQNFGLLDFIQNHAYRLKLGFHPRAFYKEPIMFRFDYEEIKNGIAKIFIDSNDQVAKYIVLSPGQFIIRTWRDYLLHSGILSVKVAENPIRICDSDEAAPLKIQNSYNYFKASKVKGDWIKLKCVNIFDTPCKSKEFNGWIRWRRNSRLIVFLSTIP